MPPGGGPPVMHRHEPGDVLLRGRRRVHLLTGDPDGPVRRLTPTGDVVPLAGGTPHTIRNESEADAVAFVVHAPGEPMENSPAPWLRSRSTVRPPSRRSWPWPPAAASNCSARFRPGIPVSIAAVDRHRGDPPTVIRAEVARGRALARRVNVPGPDADRCGKPFDPARDVGKCGLEGLVRIHPGGVRDRPMPPGPVGAELLVRGIANRDDQVIRVQNIFDVNGFRPPEPQTVAPAGAQGAGMDPCRGVRAGGRGRYDADRIPPRRRQLRPRRVPGTDKNHPGSPAHRHVPAVRPRRAALRTIGSSRRSCT